LRVLNAGTFAGDIETVRRALGYRRIMLVGYFYGARIATTYLRRWPQHVTAVALTDLGSPDVAPPVASARAAQAAVAATIHACAEAAACHAAYPRLASEYGRVLRRLTAPPRAAGGPIVADGRALLSWLDAPTARRRTAADWPAAVHDLDQGHESAAIEAFLKFRAGALSAYPLAERLSVECAENLAPPPKVVLAGTTSAAIAASGDGVLAEIRACRSWPHGRYRQPRPRPAAAPVLAITGAHDIAGSPAEARHALSAWPRARLVILPGRSRAADDDWDLCVGPMVTAFLSAPARPPDTACVARLRDPDFNTAEG
jgi:pimeloyl-ACP methyl ester carboxylesterase